MVEEGGMSIKKGVRVLGIAESFKRKFKHSVLAGVVMRGDFQIDGFAFSKIEVGGMDATHGILQLFSKLQREDVNFVMLSGCVISWFNIVDVDEVHGKTGIPLIAVTYEESEGLEKYIREYFGDWQERLRAYEKLGERKKIKLKTGHEVFVRCAGISEKGARTLLNRFTLHGRYPEPIRVARLLARAAMNFIENEMK